jgi:hypothetical protein
MPKQVIHLFGGRLVNLEDSITACTICGATVAPTLMGFHLTWHDPQLGREYDDIHAAVYQQDKDP